MKQALSLLLLFTSLACFSQINYKPGYFITNNGTRTECLIRNVAWKDNPVEFDYKADEGSETKKGVIKDVSEFGVEGYKFKRFTVSIDRSSTIMDQMSTSAIPEWKTETLFLKILVEGKATLYQYEDGNVVKYFFSTGDHATAEQLLYREHKENGVIKVNTKFRQQLYNLMRDTKPDVRLYENTRYQKSALTDLFVDYNGGNGEVKDLTAKQNRSSVNFKITPGISMASVTVKDRLGNAFGYDFDAKPAFRIGGEVEYIMPFNNNKWALFADPNIQFYKNDGRQNQFDWKIEYKFIEVPFGARHYMYLNNDSKIFLDAAYAIVLSVGDPHISYNDIPRNISKSSNFTAGAGFAHKKYSAELRYGFGRGLTDLHDTWGATYTSVSLILGYKLF
ncbi:hypothetical protein HYN59_17210 [Flavobacterium album]|uniref:tRNA modification GTPase n=1 Tax=Flavobacterium album TaxID=2175091 RepID=A0A2S1R2E0_9FLAO|nr:hypothetical protein [Flavobacterium album]AWH86739.1 hypothetical protein HYN59_17210 [Flavobacterium album]